MTITASSPTKDQQTPNVVPFTRARANSSSSLPEESVTQLSGYNNYYYTRAREDTTLDVIAEMYLDTLGRPMPRYIQQEAEQLLASGIQADMICAVLAYTAAAPRPSWAYAKAVIEKQAAMGARTAADFHGNVSSWRQARATPKPAPEQPKKRVLEQTYSQRQYGPEYDEIPEDQLKELKKL